MNVIDQIVLTFSPARGASRILARKRANVLMNYDGASRGRRTAGWKAPAKTADGAARYDRARLRDLSRDMIRNRSFATRAQAVVTNNVVGVGILPSLARIDGAAREDLLNRITDHFGSTSIDFFGLHSMFEMQRLVQNTVFSDGEILVRRRIRNRSGAAILQVQLYEADFLNPNIRKDKTTGNEIVEGIEIADDGEIVAYHLFTRNPQDVGTYGQKSERVAASEIAHIYRGDRPGQLRGVPWLAPVMLTLGEISDYSEAQILKQRLSAVLTGFVENDEADATVEGEADSAFTDVQVGALTHLEPGKRVVFPDAPQAGGFEQFIRQALASVAVGVGITFESLAGDLRQVNFSSARMGRMEMDRNIEVWQQHLVIGQFCDVVARWFLEVETARSTAFKGAKILWTAPVRALVDPTKEIPAMIKEIDAGLLSLQRAQRMRGRDPAIIRVERAEDLSNKNSKEEK